MKYALAVGCLVLVASCMGCSREMATAPSRDYPNLSWYASHQQEVGRVSLERMTEIINRAYAAHPDSAVGPVRAFIWAELQEAKRQPKTPVPSSAESYSLFDLTWQETMLLMGEPWYGPPTNTCKSLAVNETNRQWPGYGQFQDRADAFRHAHWNVLMCIRINEDWARKYSAAHESEIRNGLLDAQMDLNNNGIGRALWRSYGRSRSEGQYTSLIKGWQYVKVSSFNGAQPYLIFLSGS